MEKSAYVQRGKHSLERMYKTIDICTYIITGVITLITIGYNAPLYVSCITMSITFLPIICKILASKSYWDSTIRCKDDPDYSKNFNLWSRVVNWLFVILFLATVIIWLLRGYPSSINNTDLIKFLSGRGFSTVDFCVTYSFSTVSNFFVCVVK